MEEVIKKLRFKTPGVIINAPEYIKNQFKNAGFKTSFSKKEKATNSIFFINDKEEFLGFLKNDLDQIEYDSVLWFAYPKGTSKIKTEVNRDTISYTGEEFNISTVSAISIDETWSALRFRPTEKVGK